MRVIKERNSGMSRGFAFIDFHTVVLTEQVLIHYSFRLSCTVNKTISSPQEAARRMMEGTAENGLEIDGRNVFFEYRYVCFFFILKHCKSLHPTYTIFFYNVW